MFFDLPAFLRYNFKAIFISRNKNYRLTPKRALVMAIWLLIYIPGEIIYHLFLLLDEVFFPKYHRQEVKQPVFIIGNPRSGTTFLHQLMNEDVETFTSFKVWELIFAPSILQRKMIWGSIRIAKWIGAPVQKILRSFNKRMSKRTKAHAIRIDAAEEDDHILIHSWSSATLWPLYPIPEELLPYFYFDRDLPRSQQDRVMRQYKNMVQRHLYAHGGKLTLLSKNPAQSPKIASLLRTFPDARFINLARNPIETLPSMMDYMATGWRLFCDPVEEYPHQKDFFEVMGFYYRYPMEFFKDKPDTCYFIRYDNLIQRPQQIVSEVYEFLELEISPSYALRLEQGAEKSKHFHSEHTYTVENMNITTQQIEDEFLDVFKFYEFPSEKTNLADQGVFIQYTEWRLAKKQRRRLKVKKRRRIHLKAKEIKLE